MAAHRGKDRERRATIGSGAGEAVVGVFDRERLSGALVATHRAGFGAHARVLDPSRGDLPGQLQRAGFPLPLGVEEFGGSTLLILVTAPGRAAAAGQTLARAGALAVHVLQRGPATPPPISVPAEAVAHPLLDLAPQAGDELGA